MTKNFLCVKIFNMKKFCVKNIKIVSVFALAVLFFVCSAIFALPANKVYADDEYKANYFLPSSKLEYLSLFAPSDAVCHDGTTAIMTTNSLFVYKNGQSASVDATTFTEVEKYNDSLLVSSESRLFKINVSKLFSSQNFTLNQENQLSDEAISYFKTNGNYLVTSYATYLRVFSITENGVSKLLDKNILAEKSDVAINSENKIFFVTNSGVCMMTLDGDIQNKDSYAVLSSAKPKKMVADSDYLYYIDENSTICRLAINENSPKPQTFAIFDQDSSFELGKPQSPINLSFKDNKTLLVTSGDTIQEFSIDNPNATLTFTGFAIARNKTAYNRVSTTAVEIEKQGDTVAVLDGRWLKVINTNTPTLYDRENFTNSTDAICVDGEKPDAFALGNNSVLLSYSHNLVSGSLRFMEFGENPSQPLKPFGENSIRDITYQCGYYYALVYDGTCSTIYRASEDNLVFEQMASISGELFLHLAVDVYENFYIATANKINLLTKQNNYKLSLVSDTLTSVKKMQTDLSGALFVLDQNSVYYNTNSGLVELDISAPSKDVKSFALDYINNEVFFLYNGHEFIGKASNLPNISFKDVTVPQSFITTGANADIETLKVFTAKDGANVFTVKKNDQVFEYTRVDKCTNEYLYICSIEHSTAYRSLSMHVLAGQDTLVLIHSTQVDDVTEQTLNKTTAPEKAYITTDVSGYFLPLITVNGDYALTDENTVSLQKHSKISPLTTITYLDREFYYAYFEVNGKTHAGYIPKSFTVETLAEDFKWEKYTVEKVIDTALFSDVGLTEKVLDLKEDTAVKIIKKYDNYSYVAVIDQNGEWTFGYISNNAIKDPAGVAVRNVLIILLVCACLFGTAIYFIQRKKQN